MAKSDYLIMDSDMHIVEPLDLWLRYITPNFRDRAPQGLGRGASVDHQIVLEGRPLHRPYPSPQAEEARRKVLEKTDPIYSIPESMGYDGISQVMAMDQEGIDVAVLFPSRGLFVLARDNLDPELALAISRAYNDWLYDFCQTDPYRMYGAGMIPPHNIKGAIEESRRCVEKLGFKAVFMRPNRVNGRNWHDSYYDPLWHELERLGIPIGFHEGGESIDLPQAGAEFESWLTHHTCSHSMGMMLATVSCTGGGILEKFPTLKAAFLEANCSWAPWLLWRMDEHYESRGKYEHPGLSLKPSDYLKRQCYVAVDCDEEPAKYLSDWGFEDIVVFSTDYPHIDSKYPNAVERFLELPLLNTAKRKFLWDNCARLYGFGD